VDGKWLVHLNGGRIATEREVLEWAREGEERGAGEILLTSMDNDGTRGGFSIDITRTLSTSLGIPVIASGGAGTMEHFTEVFRVAKADAALAAGIFHTRTIALPDLKAHLIANGIPIRP